MKFTKTTPCSVCPFRRTSLKGWLGGNTPEGFAEETMGDALMPCHSDKIFIKEGEESSDSNWGQTLLASKMQHCAGARIFFKNQCKMSRNPYYLEAKANGEMKDVEKSADVFTFRHEFIEHHKGKISE